MPHMSESRVSSAPQRQSVTFEQMFDEWRRYKLCAGQKTAKKRTVSLFQRYLLPSLGHRSASDVRPSDLLGPLTRVEGMGFRSTAALLLKETIRLYRFAVASGLVTTNPAEGVLGLLRPWRPRHRATVLVPERVGQLLLAIDNYEGRTLAKHYALLLPLVFVRPSELLEAEWSEFDLDRGEWRIPARRMKARLPHIVPLSTQAQALFLRIRRTTGGSRYVFPSAMSKSGCLTRGICTSIVRRIGFRGEMTMSGFRSMAATLLSEQGWSSDAIDRQLSHVQRGPILRHYNFAQYLPERRRMMQSWADYLENLLRKARNAANERLRSNYRQSIAMYAIGRLQEKPNVWRWTVNFTRRGKGYCKSFYDLKCGGSKEALNAAIAWRDRKLGEIGVLRRREFREVRRTDNQSGAPGVLFVQSKKQSRGSWMAKMRIGEGKSITKSFAVKKYGYQDAFARAVVARQHLLRHVRNEPFLHHPLAKKLARRRGSNRPRRPDSEQRDGTTVRVG